MHRLALLITLLLLATAPIAQARELPGDLDAAFGERGKVVKAVDLAPGTWASARTSIARLSGGAATRLSPGVRAGRAPPRVIQTCGRREGEETDRSVRPPRLRRGGRETNSIFVAYIPEHISLSGACPSLGLFLPRLPV